MKHNVKKIAKKVDSVDAFLYLIFMRAGKGLKRRMKMKTKITKKQFESKLVKADRVFNDNGYKCRWTYTGSFEHVHFRTKKEALAFWRDVYAV